MLFNSLDFAIFLPIVFVLYWFITARNLKLQNLLIVAASYLFYGWWDWRFLSLILFSTVVDYLVGLGLSMQENLLKRRVLLMFTRMCLRALICKICVMAAQSTFALCLLSSSMASALPAWVYCKRSSSS